MSRSRASAAVTFVHAGVAVLQNCQLVDFPKLFEQRLQVLLLQVPRDLPDKQLDGILVFHGAALRMDANGFGPVHGFGGRVLGVLVLMRGEEERWRRGGGRSGGEQTAESGLELLLLLLPSSFSLSGSGHSEPRAEWIIMTARVRACAHTRRGSEHSAGNQADFHPTHDARAHAVKASGRGCRTCYSDI